MPLNSGSKLGHFEILSQLGAGGMGEVYKARDARLDRIVAIKVLPTHLASRSELRERFEREARTIASLNHPHICTLHDIGRENGIDYLVLEYLEDETLAQRLERLNPNRLQSRDREGVGVRIGGSSGKGQNQPPLPHGRGSVGLPLDEVLQYAIEIADALDKAHRKNITHRDIKPGNIMLIKSGSGSAFGFSTKLLDFGLAKFQQEAQPVKRFSQLTTGHTPLTKDGSIIGTPQYMAPEQVEGRNDDLDARTDIFSFGATIYEMATGRRAFEGSSQASVMAKILEHDPPHISSLQPMTPPALDRLVKKCLAKEPDRRWQSASDVCDELRWIKEGGGQAAMPVPLAAPRYAMRDRFLGVVAILAALIAALLGCVNTK